MTGFLLFGHQTELLLDFVCKQLILVAAVGGLKVYNGQLL